MVVPPDPHSSDHLLSQVEPSPLLATGLRVHSAELFIIMMFTVIIIARFVQQIERFTKSKQLMHIWLYHRIFVCSLFSTLKLCNNFSSWVSVTLYLPISVSVCTNLNAPVEPSATRIKIKSSGWFVLNSVIKVLKETIKHLSKLTC